MKNFILLLILIFSILFFNACTTDKTYVPPTKVEPTEVEPDTTSLPVPAPGFEDVPEMIVQEELEADELDSEFEDDDQFKSDKLHWTHMPVTYHILNPGHVLKDCERYESNKIRKGFSRIEEATNGVVFFKETILKDADIVISCSFLENCYKKSVDTSTKDLGYVLLGESICEHSKGLARITETERYKILKAEIEMIGLAGFSETKNKGVSGFFFGSCGHPTTEIHEILHTFGYDHSFENDSIMYYLDDVSGFSAYSSGDCIGSNKEIEDWIVEDLIETYSK